MQRNAYTLISENTKQNLAFYQTEEIQKEILALFISKYVKILFQYLDY